MNIVLFIYRAFVKFRPITALYMVTDLVFLFFFKEYWYLLVFMLIADLIAFLSHGAWTCTKAHSISTYNPHRRGFYPAAVIKICCGVAGTVAVIASIIGSPLPSYILSPIIYIAVITSMAEAMRRLLYTMQKYSRSWLDGAHGRLGFSNCLSIMRIAIPSILPHLFYAHPFGAHSSHALAIFVLGLSLSTDCIDGWYARQAGEETRAGRYLDPLGDKLLFVPLGITFIVMSAQLPQQLPGLNVPLTTFLVICIGFSILRDVLFFIWFFVSKKKTGVHGIKAGIVDKLRMIVACAWLVCMALIVYIGSADNEILLLLVKWLTLGLTLLSALSFIVDTLRLRLMARESRRYNH